MIWPVLIAITIAFAFVLPVRAQATEEELLLSFGDEDFVSIATGQQQSLAKAPAVATVITSQQIEAMGATNLDQVLEAVPGLHVSLSSTRLSPIYSMRGIHTDKNPQVLMLMNGVPLTQAYFGDRGARSTLPVRNIARVEVIRGPGSAVYGADAFAGVINVITKTASQIDGTEIGVRFGSFNTQELWLLQGSQLGEVNIAFSLDLEKTDGDGNRIIVSDQQSVFDSVLGTSASLAPGPADTRQKRADIRLELAWKRWKLSGWNWRQHDMGVGPGLALALDPDGNGETNNFLFDLVYANHDSVADWEFEVAASYMDINTESEQQLNPAGAVLPLGCDGNVNALPQDCDGNAETPDNLRIGNFVDGLIGNPAVFETHSRVDGSAFYNGFQRHTLRLAAGGNYTSIHGEETKNYGPGVIDPVLPFQLVDGTLTSVTGTSDIFIPDESRQNFYGSLQDEWILASDWNLTLGLRYDYYSDFGSTMNPRAALVWNTMQELTTKLLYGRAFRAPSFAELYTINNPVLRGNPDLDPETINTFELAFDYRPLWELRTGLNLFYYKIDDLIQFVPDAGGSQLAQNTGGQTGYGFELEADWSIMDKLSLAGHYAFQRSEYDTSGERVGSAPGEQLFGELRWAFALDWEFSSRAYWIGGRKRDAGDPRDDIDDYTQVFLVLRRKNLFNHLDLELVGQNIFSQSASEPSPVESSLPGGSLVPGDFPLEGRGLFFQARYRFK